MNRRIVALMTTLALSLFGTNALAQDEGMGGGEAGGGDEMGGGDATGGGEEMGGGEASGGGELQLSGDDVSGGGAAKPISVGLLVGYGISLEDGPNPWGLGFGLEGGYTLDMGLYLGAKFVYHLGESQDVQILGTTISVDSKVWTLGAEVGYVVDAGSVDIRPGVEFGLAGNGGSELYLAPGAAFLFDVSDNIYVGAEADFQLVLASTTFKGIILLATGGMRF